MDLANSTRITLPHALGSLVGNADGSIDRIMLETGELLQRYHFTDFAVRWLLATPDGSKLVAGHDDGLVIVFEPISGKEIRESSAEMQSEYNPAVAQTTGELSPGGRWLLVTIRKHDHDVGALTDLNREYRPRRYVGPHGSNPGRPAEWP